jgi:hypothetical protein
MQRVLIFEISLCFPVAPLTLNLFPRSLGELSNVVQQSGQGRLPHKVSGLRIIHSATSSMFTCVSWLTLPVSFPSCILIPCQIFHRLSGCAVKFLMLHFP